MNPGEHLADSTAVIELTSRLIAAPTPNPPGDERPAAAVVKDALASYGLPAPRTLALTQERPNLMTTLDFGPGGRHLCLAGHLDTKPVGSAAWHTDPLRAEAGRSRISGLGAADMKGALAAFVLAARRLASAPPPRGRLTLLFTSDEEGGGEWGARHIVNSGALEADGVVIGEPGGLAEDFDRLHLVSRGFARLRLEVSGDQGHSGLSVSMGATNASVEMARLLVAFSEDFEPTVREKGPLEGWDANVTGGVHVSGGVTFGVIPGSAGFDAEVRLLPGMSQSQLKRDLEQFLAVQQRRQPRLRPRLIFEDLPQCWLPATQVSGDDPLAVAARHALWTVLGKEPPDCVFPGATDAAFFQGVAGIPTLPALGPGLLSVAHGADEWVATDALASSVDLYEALARDYCA